MILEYRLQFFADGPGGEKTEPATEKKLSDARKEGQVAKSREIANAFGILALFLIIRFGAGKLGTQFLEIFQEIYRMIPEVVKCWNGTMPEQDLLVIFREILLRIMLLLAPVFLIAVVVALVCEIAQVQWHPTGKPLKPKFSKISPVNGVKKIFSLNSLAELIKALLKIGLIIFVCYLYFKKEWPFIFTLYDISLMQAIGLLGKMVTDLGIRISAVYMVIAFADLIYQKVKFSHDMRMTVQEVKEEYKQQEGDPQVKGKIRQKMREVSQRRMMQAVPKADVIITNPTHYAVAILYDADKYDAPIVVAKGEDYLAMKIKEIARENDVEIVENKPLARMLYANVGVNQAIPPELYQAVAEVLAFVYHLKGKA